MKSKVVMLLMAVGLFTTGAMAQEKPKKGDKAGMLEKLDTDKDGKLSKAEVDASDKGSLKEKFAVIDTNKDLYLDKEELKAYRKEKKAEKAVKKQK